MEKQQIPRALARVKVLPVTYNDALSKFIVGTSEERVDTRNFLAAIRHQQDRLPFKQVKNLIAGSVYGEEMVTGPGFHDFIESEGAAKTLADTREVMFDVFNQVHSIQVPKSTIGGGFGFEAERFRAGQVLLSVLGNCACFGPDLYGHVVHEDEWSAKFAEYEPHNIDFPAQLVSLCVGIGYIAYKASES